MKSKITTIRVLHSEDKIIKSVLLHKTEDQRDDHVISISVSISQELCISEERRIQELNKNIEQAKIALDNYTSQHQGILYRLKSFFKHVT